MLRYSNGLRAIEGNDIEKRMGYVLYQSNDNLKKHAHASTNWLLTDGKEPNNRFWLLKHEGNLTAFKKPLDGQIFDWLCMQMAQLHATELHPVFTLGTSLDAQRLFPNITAKELMAYDEFVSFLITQFELNLANDQKMEAYTDDFGPSIIGFCEDNPLLLPEIPALYLAPAQWLRACWIINNCFSGPYQEKSEAVVAANGNRFYWSGYLPRTEESNRKFEGIIYFLIARFILIHQAWLYRDYEGQLKGESLLLEYIELIRIKNQRPWLDLCIKA